MTALLFSVIFACAHRSDAERVVCKEDGQKREVFLPDCKQDFAREAKEAGASFTRELDVFGKVDAAQEAQVSKKVMALSDSADQLTRQYEDTLIAFCQASRSDPCNTELQMQILALQAQAAKDFADARRAVVAAQSAARGEDPQEAVLSDLDAATQTLESLKARLEQAAPESK